MDQGISSNSVASLSFATMNSSGANKFLLSFISSPMNCQRRSRERDSRNRKWRTTRQRHQNYFLVLLSFTIFVLCCCVDASPSSLSQPLKQGSKAHLWSRFLTWKRKQNRVHHDHANAPTPPQQESFPTRHFLEPGVVASHDSDVKDTRNSLEEQGTDVFKLKEDIYYEYEPKRRSPLAALSGMLSDLLGRHPSWVGKVAARCVQVGLLAYLGYTGWKIAGEIVEAVEDDSFKGASSPLLVKSHAQVQRIVDVLLQDPTGKQTNNRKTTNSDIPVHLLQLSQKLLRSGMPIVSKDETTTTIETLLLSLTKGEAAVLEQCLLQPNESLWESVIGLKLVQQQLRRTVTMLRTGSTGGHYPSLFGSNTGRSQLPGVLLYGPPGCGKSLLVQGLASMGPCLVLTPSVLLRKYVGESNSQVRHLFSLISKLAPCILCIDELDGLFRERSDREDEITREIKTEFFQWWDGLLSTTKPVLVIGATNRPFDVDAAVLRRLPQSYFVGFPDSQTRRKLMERLLADVPLVKSFAWGPIAERTAGYSPSDMRNLLQMATILSTGRMLSHNDVLRAMHFVTPPRLSAMYKTKLQVYLAGDPNNKANMGEEEGDSTSNRWQTVDGNFYDLGTLEIDPPTFEALTEIAKAMTEDSDDEEL